MKSEKDKTLEHQHHHVLGWTQQGPSHCRGMPAPSPSGTELGHVLQSEACTCHQPGSPRRKNVCVHTEPCAQSSVAPLS